MFSLDVEGYELQVLQGLDMERYRPRLILVEENYPAEVEAYLAPWYERHPAWRGTDALYRAR